MTPQDDAAIREIVREQTLGQCRAQTLVALNKFKAQLAAAPTNALYKAAVAAEQARYDEYVAREAIDENVVKVIGLVDTLEASAATLSTKLATINPAAITEAVVAAVTPIINTAVAEAVTDAFDNATVNAEVGAADIAKIAQASAAATVAEIAS